MLFTLLNDETLRAQPSHVKDIFNEEACRGGYEGGNADKPERVKVSIRSALTPLLTKMAYKIQKGYLSWNSLNDRQCDIDPGQYESYDYDPYFDPATFTCEKSRDFPE